jgi:hypothetical protein
VERARSVGIILRLSRGRGADSPKLGACIEWLCNDALPLLSSTPPFAPPATSTSMASSCAIGDRLLMERACIRHASLPGYREDRKRLSVV